MWNVNYRSTLFFNSYPNSDSVSIYFCVISHIILSGYGTPQVLIDFSSTSFWQMPRRGEIRPRGRVLKQRNRLRTPGSELQKTFHLISDVQCVTDLPPLNTTCRRTWSLALIQTSATPIYFNVGIYRKSMDRL